MSFAGVGKILNKVIGATKANPVSTGIIGVGGGGLLAADVMGPVVKSAGDPLGKEVTGLFRERAAGLAQKAKARRLESAMRENEARLAALSPDLYAMLVAGERLPIGGRTFGGVPQRELVNAVTARMSTGGFTQRTPEDEIRDLLTG